MENCRFVLFLSHDWQHYHCHVNEIIIRVCGTSTDGYTMAKFLERGESMAHSPFLVNRTFGQKIPPRGLIYRIKLKTQ
jgi:hypothetical protein